MSQENDWLFFFVYDFFVCVYVCVKGEGQDGKGRSCVCVYAAPRVHNGPYCPYCTLNQTGKLERAVNILYNFKD
jgi:hypothetical protein